MAVSYLCGVVPSLDLAIADDERFGNPEIERDWHSAREELLPFVKGRVL